MTERATRDAFRVRGEDSPAWLPWVLALLGLAGSVAAAQLLMPVWWEEPTRVSLPVEVAADGAPSRLPMDVVQEPVPPGSDAGGLDPGGDSALNRAAFQAVDPQGEGSPLASPQLDREPALVEDGEALAPASPDDPAVGTAVEPSIETLAEPAYPSADPFQAGTRTDAALSTDSVSESLPAPVSPVDPAISGSAGQESVAVMLPQFEFADSTDAQDPGRTSPPSTKGQTNAVQTQPEQPADANLDRGSGETDSDCAPLFSVGFNHGSVAPPERDIGQQVTRLVEWLSAHPTAVVHVDGHSDSSGPEELNLVISFRRALAVAALLKEAGASEAQVVPRAYGASSSPDSPAKSASNRRVTLRTDDGAACPQQESQDGDL